MRGQFGDRTSSSQAASSSAVSESASESLIRSGSHCVITGRRLKPSTKAKTATLIRRADTARAAAIASASQQTHAIRNCASTRAVSLWMIL